MACVLTTDAVNFVSSQSPGIAGSASPFGGGALSGFNSKLSLNAWAIKHGQAWRVITGALINGSLITTALCVATVWWLGRQTAPQVKHAQFLAITMAAVGGGALAVLVAEPNGNSFGGLSLSGGLAATYLILRKRNLVGRLRMPAGGQFGYLLFFVGSMIYSALTSESGGIYALFGGAVAAGILAWFLLDPLRPDATTRNAAIGATFLGVALLGVATGVAFAADPKPYVPTTQTDLAGYVARFQQMETPTDGEWVTVRRWEERTDIGDVQIFHLQCGPVPSYRLTDTNELVDPKAVCDWLGSHPDALTATETVDTCLDDPYSIVWRIQLSGTFHAKAVSSLFEGGTNLAGTANCASALSREAEAHLVQLQ